MYKSTYTYSCMLNSIDRVTFYVYECLARCDLCVWHSSRKNIRKVLVPSGVYSSLRFILTAYGELLLYI